MENIKNIVGLIPKGLIVASLSSRDKGEGPEYHFEKASALIICRDYAGAAAELKKAISIRPNDPEAHYDMGVVLSRLGRLDDAMESFIAAIKLKPSFAEAHYNLGSYFCKEGHDRRRH